MKKYLLLAFLGVFSLPSFGQIGVNGTWEGTITLERPAPRKEYKFELVIKKEGKKVIGTSYIYFENEEPVAMNLHGWYYYDNSMWLFNEDVLYPSEDPDKGRHIRKYQIMYKRSAFTDDYLEGHWQEINDPIFEKYRKGFVKLTRKKTKPKA